MRKQLISLLSLLLFRLRAGSPAINAGTDVGLTEDFAGRKIRGLRDIGAYEYQPVGSRSLLGVGQ